MQKTVELLNNEKNSLIDSKIQTDAFTKDAVNFLRAKLNILRKILLAHTYVEPWNTLVYNREKKSRLSEMAHIRNSVSKLTMKVNSVILLFLIHL